MKQFYIFLGLIILLSGCGGDGNQSNNDSSSFILPAVGSSVDTSDPVGIWVAVGKGTGSRYLVNGVNNPYYEEGDDKQENSSFDFDRKMYFSVRRNSLGQIERPCDSSQVLSNVDNKFIYEKSGSDTYNSVQEIWNESISIEFLNNGQLKMLSHYASSESGTVSNYNRRFDRKSQYNAVKISDSTDFNDLYEFSFHTTDGVDSFTDDTQSGSKDLLCALYDSGKVVGTKNSSSYTLSSNGIDLYYDDPSSEFSIFRESSANEDRISFYADMGQLSVDYFKDCLSSNCNGVMDIDNSTNGLTLNSINGNYISELIIKSSE
jgi:hypothetical protein|tara:strand:+ start:5209 stop:6165 length:957 start_codon:yes stop_codon:yes gene_type:complete